MALQGDLESFALPDVLRLLAGTGKSGRLEVTHDPGSGEVWLQDGLLVGGSVTSAPHATSPADVVFELLRFNGGQFAFDDSEELVDEGERVPVDEVIGAAEALVAEWTEIEVVVPSVHGWVTLAEELPGDEATISADDWRLLAGLAPGATVRAIGEVLEVTDLVASRRVKGLVEAGLVALGEAPEGALEEDEFPAPVAVAEPDHDDLAILSAEDGPVILETSDDALLPEPLPGEGTSFVDDIESGAAVDGRSFEAHEPEAAYEPFEAPAVPETAPEAVAEPVADVRFDAEPSPWSYDAPLDQLPPPPAEGAPAWQESEGSSWGELQEHPTGWGEAELAALAGMDDDEAAEAAHVAQAEAKPAEDDRGSLLKFLSSVKP